MKLISITSLFLISTWVTFTSAFAPHQPFAPNPFDHPLLQHFYSDAAPLVPDLESARLAALPTITGSNVSPLPGYETGQAQVLAAPGQTETTLSPETGEANAEAGTEGGAEEDAENQQAEGGQSKEAREAQQDNQEGDDDTTGADEDNDNSSSAESSESENENENENENEGESNEGGSGRGSKYYGGRPGSAIPPHFIPAMGPLPEPGVIIRSAPLIMLPPKNGMVPSQPLDRVVAHFPYDYLPPALISSASLEQPPHVPVGIVSPIAQPHLIPLHKGKKFNPENVDINIHQQIHNNYSPVSPVAPVSPARNLSSQQPAQELSVPVQPDSNNNSQPANLDISAKLTEGPSQGQQQPHSQQEAQGPQQSGYGSNGSPFASRNSEPPSSGRLSVQEVPLLSASEQAQAGPPDSGKPVPNAMNERPTAYSSGTPRNQYPSAHFTNQNQRQSRPNQEQFQRQKMINQRPQSQEKLVSQQPPQQSLQQPQGQSVNQQPPQQPQSRALLTPEELRRNQQISSDMSNRDLAEALSRNPNPGPSNARSLPATSNSGSMEAPSSQEAATFMGSGQSSLTGNAQSQSGGVDVTVSSKETLASNPQEVGVRIFFKRSAINEKEKSTVSEVRGGRKGAPFKSRFRNSNNGSPSMTSSVQRLRKGKLHRPADIQKLQRKIASGYKLNSRSTQISSDDFP